MNKNQLQLVNFEQAKRLKDLGFDWEKDLLFRPPFDNPKLGNWSRFLDPEKEDCVFAPTVALALMWCRDEKGINEVGIIPHNSELGMHYYYIIQIDNSEFYSTYPAAEFALLDELLTLIEKQNEK